MIEPLTDAYLRWKYLNPMHTEDGQSVADDQNAMGMSVDAGEGRVEYTVDTYDLWTLNQSLTVMRKQSSDSAALDIMAHGYLVKSPTRPTVAISMRTLELLYRLRQRKASFSIEAFAKVICDYYQVSLRTLYAKRWLIVFRCPSGAICERSSETPSRFTFVSSARSKGVSKMI